MNMRYELPPEKKYSPLFKKWLEGFNLLVFLTMLQFIANSVKWGLDKVLPAEWVKLVWIAFLLIPGPFLAYFVLRSIRPTPDERGRDAIP